MLHDPHEGTTPSQRLAAARRRERMDRIRSAGRWEPALSKFTAPAVDETTLPPIPNKLMAEAVEIETAKPVFGQVEAIQRAVLAFYPKATLNDLKSARRTDAVVRPRQIAMFLVKELTTRSFPDIGRRFGGRDHTTVIHAVRKISALLKTDMTLAAHIVAIKAVIAGAGA